MADKPPEDGFELGGEFYRWHVTDNGKDLMLIDRFTAMPIQEFFEIIEDTFDRGRAPVLLAMLATSIRAKHPDWSVERIARTVMGTNLSDVAFIEGDAEEEKPLPPDAAAEEAAADSTSSADGSLPLLEPTTSVT